MNHKLLFVDDEPNILAALERVFFAEEYELLTTTTGAEALGILASHQISLIITDQRMPGMNGIELLEQIITVSPDSVRFVLTGYADTQSTIDAINRGKVHRYFHKPWNDDELRAAVAFHLHEIELREEVNRLHLLTLQQNHQLRQLNTQLSERTEEVQQQNVKLQQVNYQIKQYFGSLVKVLANSLELYDQALGSHCIRVATHAERLGRKLGLDEEYCEQIYVAGLLHDIGLIGVPQAVVKKYKKKMPLSPDESKMIQEHPSLGANLTNLDKSFERISQLIRMHHEHYDGSGYPDGLKNYRILVGSQAIAVADKYDDIMCRNNNEPELRLHQEAVQYLRQGRQHLYDGDTVDAYVELLEHELAQTFAERPVPVKDLEAGLTLSRHLYSPGGLMMLASGVRLDKELVQRLTNGMLPPDALVYVQLNGSA